MDDAFEMTTDINGKPIPQWQARLEAMYTDGVPFGEILSLVRYLLEERDISTILNAPDEDLLADFKARGGDIEQYAAEMRQRFNVIGRLVHENEVLRLALEAVVFFWERDPLSFGDEATPTTLAGRFADVAQLCRTALRKGEG